MILRLWTTLLFALLCTTSVAWFIALMHEKNLRPVRELVAFYKKHSVFGRVVLSVFFIGMCVYGSTKSGPGGGNGGGEGGGGDGGTNNLQMVIGPGGGLQPLDSPGTVTDPSGQGLTGEIQPTQGGTVGDPAPVTDEWTDFTPITSPNTTRTLDGDDFRRGFVLTGIGTGETFGFDAPADATVCADWLSTGAAEDWIYLAFEDWAFRLGTNEVDRVRVFSFGKVDPLPPAKKRWFAPFVASLGIAPQTNWWMLAEADAASCDRFVAQASPSGNPTPTARAHFPSRFWHLVTPSNTLQLTWQNVLLDRATNTPVNVQMEMWPSGRFAYRYDLSRLDVDEVTNILVGASLGTLDWTTNALPTNVTSLAFYPLTAEDAVDTDRDGDGLSLLDELFAFGTDPELWDTDFDGISDGVEVAAGVNPHTRDSDGDSFVDGTDVRPLEADSWADADGDGLPDAWRDGWFGTNATVAAEADANADGISNIAALMMGVNPVATPAEGFAVPHGTEMDVVTAWEIAPTAFQFSRPGGLTNLVSRTIPVNRESPWEQFFVSSRPDGAAGWGMSDVTLLYGLDGDPVTNEVPVSGNDSWRIPLGDAMPQTISFRLDANGDAPTLSAPLYILRWAPRIEFLPSADVTVIAGTNGHVYAAAKRNPETGAYAIPFRVDTSGIPCGSGNGGDVAADLALPPVEGVAVTNGVARAFTADDPLMADLPREGTNLSKRLLFYSIEFERVGAVKPGPRASRYASPYPLTSSSLRKSFHVATGVTADGSVALRLSPDVPELDYTTEALPMRGGLRLLGTTAGGSKSGSVTPPATVTPSVCGGACSNDTYEIDFEYPEDHDEMSCDADWYGCFGDEEGDGCCGCGDGGSSLGSFRIRIPFGESAKDENLGYLWTVMDGPTAVTPSAFGVLAAQGVTVVTNAGGTLAITCTANGGKTLMVTNIAHGVAIPVWNASGRFESRWEVWNEGGDTSRIRVRRVTVLNNATVDETYATWTEWEPVVFGETRGEATVWEKTDNISGVANTRYEWHDGSDPDFIAEEYEETRLGGDLVRAEQRTFGKIGAGSSAQRRLVRAQGYDENGSYDTVRTYWCDTDHMDRHARGRSVRSDRQPWAWHDYDASGREIVRIEQLDGSQFPELAEVSLDAALPQDCSAKITVTGYEPQSGYDAHRNDSFEPREVSVYVRHGGEAPILIAHETSLYTRETDAAGNPLRRIVKNVGLDGAVRTETTVEYPQDSAVPSHLRGLPVLVSNADGSVTETLYSLSNGCLVAESHTEFAGVERQTYDVMVTDAAYRLPLRGETRLSSNGALLEWSERTYDDIRRLRSVVYSDGTSETNAYSCCRLLWRRDRQGRKVLRSAQTGTDSLYYADEDVWLADVSTNGTYRIVQHFFDGFGRETDTVIYVGSTPGEAIIPSYPSQPSYTSQKTTTYLDGDRGGHSESTDERGKVTERWRQSDASRDERFEYVLTNGIEVVRTATATLRNGGSSTRREWPGGSQSLATAWSEERRFTDYAADGKRIEYVVTESHDCGTVTNSVSTYDLLGRLISSSVRGGNGSTLVTVNTYDGTSSRILSSTKTGSPTMTYGYNERGERISISRDGKMVLTDTSYETISQQTYRVTTTVKTTGNVTNSVQVRKVQMTGLSDALRSRTIDIADSGHVTVTETSFDVDTGILTSVSRTDGGIPVSVHSLHGVVLDQTSIDGTRAMLYDALGRNVAVVVSDTAGVTNRIDRMEYDQSGNVVRRVTDFLDGRVAESTAEYDMLNREVHRTDAHGNEAVTGYDPLDRMVSAGGDTYPLGFGYDSVGRKTFSRTTRDGGVTWDETQWEFDPESGVNTAKQYADGSRIEYSYTDNGQKTRTTWARGVWKENAYNARNLVSGTTYSEASTPSVAYAYEDSGQVASATLSDGTAYSYGYDDRLLSTNESVAVGGEVFALNRTFDGFRRELDTSVTITNVVHAAKVRSYDSENRVCGYALTNAAGRGMSVTLAYDGSYLTNMTYALPGGGLFNAKLSREPGRKELVTRRDYVFGGQSTFWYSTEYDLLGRPTNATDSVSLVREWLYNRRSELVSASIGTNLYGYAYDTIGNRLWSSANSTTNTYAANNLNQYTSAAASTNLVYDADGNMTGDGIFSYSYDAENRLVAAYPLSPVVGFLAVLNRYDHKHRRVQKIVKQYDGTTWGTIETHTFVWDGNNIVLEKIAFADGTTRTFEYFWGMDKSGTEQGAGGVEGLLAVSIDGVFYIPCYDHNGNIVLYVSEAGSIAAQYTYDPYGNITDMSGALATQFSFGFSTKYHDRELGMVSYQRRFYRPDLGRWLNRDPIEEEGGENLYVFCSNRTTYEIDMLGTSTCCRDGKKITCSNAYNWKGSVTVASATWVLGATFLMVDLVSNYICKTCTRFRLHAEAVLPTVAGGAPIALTGSNVEFRNVAPDAFVGTVVYGAAGIGAMGVAEASFLKLGSTSLFSAGIVGGGEFGAGMGVGWYVNFELTEE